VTGDRVAPIRPSELDTTAPSRRAGYLGWHWVARYVRDHQRWEAHGEHPDRPGVMRTRIVAHHLPRGADSEGTARVMAQILNDLDDGAAALMEVDLLREGKTND
jgi:hypothetical protein